MPDLPYPTRRQLLRLALSTWMGAGLAARAAVADTLPVPTALADALAQASARQQPLVLMVGLQGCPFCKAVRERYLLPLCAEGLPVVEIDMHDLRRITDFAGHAGTHDALIRAWGVRVAPTVLFFGPGGREIAERLAAYAPDFYGAYLDDRLAQARRALATPVADR